MGQSWPLALFTLARVFCQWQKQIVDHIYLDPKEGGLILWLETTKILLGHPLVAHLLAKDNQAMIDTTGASWPYLLSPGGLDQPNKKFFWGCV